ncbi:MAG TPA: oligosaccharide flippase family protein [Acidimicrobiales bacterium]|nr:oligosaccharide flippase family protein [Acidimicrobiales bacterium]
MTSSRPAEFRRDLGVTFTGQVSAVAVTLIGSIVLARMLGPSGRGAVQVLQLLTAEVALIVSLGLPVAVTYVIARQEATAATVASTATLMSLLVGSTVAVALALAAGPLASLFLSDIEGGALLVVISSVMIPLTVLESIFLSVWRGRNKFYAFNGFKLFARCGYLGGIVGAAVLGTDVTTVVFGLIAADVVTTVVLAVALFTRFDEPLRIDRVVARRLLHFNVAGHGGTLLQEVSYRLDMFIVAGLLGSRAVGLYAIAVSTSRLLWYIPESLGSVLLSRSARTGYRRERWERIGQGVTSILLFQAIGAAALAPVAIPLVFGVAFKGSVWPFILLLPGAVALGLWKVFINETTAAGHPRLKLRSGGVGSAATVILDVMLIPQWGVEGAAVASSVAYCLTLGVLLLQLRTIYGIPLHALLMPKVTVLRTLLPTRRSAPADG